MKAIRIADDFIHCTKGKIYDVEINTYDENVIDYIDNCGTSMSSDLSAWQILNKENLKENNMEKWNFTVREMSKINDDLLYDCLSPENPMLIVKIKEEKDFVIVRIHESIYAKSFICKGGNKLRKIVDKMYGPDNYLVPTNYIEKIKQAVIAIKNAPYKKKYKKLSCEVSLLDI